jgi:CheY-like chemotaxis protein
MNVDKTAERGMPGKVLVVDDTLIGLEAARNCLEACGIQVDCARNGWEAIALILKNTIGQYDIIFMDYYMPGIDGLETVKNIRETFETEYARTVPIIAYTSAPPNDYGVNFLENGFSGFLAKPMDMIKLDALFEKWRKGFRSE